MAVIDRFEQSSHVVSRTSSINEEYTILVAMTDSGTGLLKTGVSAAGDGSDIEHSIQGGAFATAPAGNRTITELGTTGIYAYALFPPATTTAGTLAIKFTIAGTKTLIVTMAILGSVLVPAGTVTLAADSVNSTSLAASAAQEIADALLATTMAELAQAAPDTTPTVAKALMLLYMALRNASTATATERAIYDNAGTKIAKATVTDNGVTFTQGKLGSGA